MSTTYDVIYTVQFRGWVRCRNGHTRHRWYYPVNFPVFFLRMRDAAQAERAVKRQFGRAVPTRIISRHVERSSPTYSLVWYDSTDR